MSNKETGHPGFPECRHGGEAAATKLPTVVLAARRIPTAIEIATRFDHELFNVINRMDNESGRSGSRTAEEIATEIDLADLRSVGSMDWGA